MAVTAIVSYLSRKQAARYLQAQGCQISPSYLAKLAHMKKGPPYSTDGGHRAVYDPAELDEWRRKRLRRVEY